MRDNIRTLTKEKDQDLVKVILEEHRPLKRLIKVMKDKHADFDERKSAFEEFAPLFVMHDKPEEEVLYMFLKNVDELRDEGFEGDVEHELADQLIEETKRTTDEDIFCARVKVLAELVEDHIEKEEKHVLPAFKTFSEREERRVLGEDYLKLKQDFEREYRTDEEGPKERTLYRHAR